MASSLSYSVMILSTLIRIYQCAISILLKPHCRFYPTCSQYGIEVLHNFGFFKGNWLILKRILKCHPFYEGGYDPIPAKQINPREY
ncbi:MAG: membrane protein insertion efficiency factor YidD [Pantoea sp. Brub]|nr:membrane protein insertion efficiency factor YidD [Pantoea sp. Brub]